MHCKETCVKEIGLGLWSLVSTPHLGGPMYSIQSINKHALMMTITNCGGGPIFNSMLIDVSFTLGGGLFIWNRKWCGSLWNFTSFKWEFYREKQMYTYWW